MSGDSDDLLAAIQRQHDERNRLFHDRLMAMTTPAKVSHPTGSLGEEVPPGHYDQDQPWGTTKGPQ